MGVQTVSHDPRDEPESAQILRSYNPALIRHAGFLLVKTKKDIRR